MSNSILDKNQVEKKEESRVRTPLVSMSEIGGNYRSNRMLNFSPGLNRRSKVFRR